MNKEKILLFYIRAGNGHYSIANAVADDLKEKYNCDVLLVDPSDKSGSIAKFLARDFYNSVLLNFKSLFEFIYFLNSFNVILRLSNFFSFIFLKKQIVKAIKEFAPDKIVSTHFFISTNVKKYLENKFNIPFVTIVTDPFTAPKFWFIEKTQKFIVSSELVKQQALNSGVKEGLIKTFPVVINKKYSNILDKAEIDNLKKKYEIELDKKVILMLSGGSGLPNGIKILKNILLNNKNIQVIVVCGSNKRMFLRVNKIIETQKLNNIKVFGFVDFVYELINISDIVVSKGGTSAVMEILLQNKIPVISNYIWGQEKGNVDFIKDNELGVYEKRYKKIGSVVNYILNNEEVLNKYHKNIRNMNLKNGLNDVSDFIKNLN